jgi:flagellar biosynthesis protein FlhF
MRFRTFNAPDMSHAMQMIRQALGSDAVIIASQRGENGKGVVVTAAAEQAEHYFTAEEAASPQAAQAGLTQDAVIEQIETVLRFHSTPEHVSSKLLEVASHLNLQGRDLHTDFTRLMAACFQYAPLPLDQESFTIMLVGPPGTGKTMTIAKMASSAVMEKKKPVIITTDNKRAGGVEQLSAFTTILNLELHIADNRGELWRLLKEFAPHHRILIDTGGVNPFNPADLRELTEYIKLDRSIEPVLVAAAGSDSAEAEDMARAFAPLGVRRMLLTRIDAARRYGSVLTAAMGGRFAFCHASNSSKIIGEFTLLNPVTLTELLLRYQSSQKGMI